MSQNQPNEALSYKYLVHFGLIVEKNNQYVNKSTQPLKEMKFYNQNYRIAFHILFMHAATQAADSSILMPPYLSPQKRHAWLHGKSRLKFWAPVQKPKLASTAYAPLEENELDDPKLLLRFSFTLPIIYAHRWWFKQHPFGIMPAFQGQFNLCYWATYPLWVPLPINWILWQDLRSPLLAGPM